EKVGFGEVLAFSIADRDGGIAELAERFVAEQGMPELAEWLAALGEPSCQALLERWERMGQRAKRQALRILDANCPKDQSEVAEAFRRLLMHAANQDETRDEAIATLVRRGEGLLLFEIALSEPKEKAKAATAIERHRIPLPPIPALLERIPNSHWERPSFRRAMARVILGSRDWEKLIFESSLSESALSSLALAFSELASSGAPTESSEAAALAYRLIERVLDMHPQSEAMAFDTQYRLLRAARVGSSPRVIQWLEEIALRSKEWMLRAAAFEAMGRSASDEILKQALADPHPRVRLVVLRWLAERPESTETMLRLFREDSWPLVRAFALSALVEQGKSQGLIHESLRDSSSALRAQALVLLRERPNLFDFDESIDQDVNHILQNDAEKPHVIRLAIEAAEAACRIQLHQGLRHVVLRGLIEGQPLVLEQSRGALQAWLMLRPQDLEEARAMLRQSSHGTALLPVLEAPKRPCQMHQGLRQTPLLSLFRTTIGESPTSEVFP
ncbi:MAG: HEAT repeat domain-containing protein, partial [Deltaproteobacteria bacterium]|nr:HEAT repeat domain-containing protein [Deltaproteobacteria bacterium]